MVLDHIGGIDAGVFRLATPPGPRERQSLDGGLPLKEIAWQVGYSHASNFVAAFTSNFGMSPRRFSQRHQPTDVDS